jgi:hypothetical protein
MISNGLDNTIRATSLVDIALGVDIMYEAGALYTAKPGKI